MALFWGTQQQYYIVVVATFNTTLNAIAGTYFPGVTPVTGIAMPTSPVYKVIFQNGNQVVELFARQIYQSDMWGFIEVEEFLFGERSQILVDPAEEKLKSEFSGVQRSYIPLQSVIRIDEVAKEGVAKISDVKPGDTANVTSFPMSSAPAKPRSSDE